MKLEMYSGVQLRKIPAKKVGHFDDADQAKNYEQAQGVKDRFDFIAAQLKTLDNQAMDLNKDLGHVVVRGVELDLGDGQKKSCDGTLVYQEGSTKVKAMDLRTQDYRIQGQVEHGWLGLGRERLHVKERVSYYDETLKMGLLNNSEGEYFKSGRVDFGNSGWW